MVRMDGEKMSKSLGNMVFVRDLLKSYSADAIRLYLLGHHYRQVWEWSPAELDAAARHRRSDLPAGRARARHDQRHGARDRSPRRSQDDLDTPRAIEILQTISGGTLRELGGVLGLTFDRDAPGHVSQPSAVPVHVVHVPRRRSR